MTLYNIGGCSSLSSRRQRAPRTLHLRCHPHFLSYKLVPLFHTWAIYSSVSIIADQRTRRFLLCHEPIMFFSQAVTTQLFRISGLCVSSQHALYPFVTLGLTRFYIYQSVSMARSRPWKPLRAQNDSPRALVWHLFVTSRNDSCVLKPTKFIPSSLVSMLGAPFYCICSCAA